MTEYARIINLWLIVAASVVCVHCANMSTGLNAEIHLDVEGNGFHRMLVYRVDFKQVDLENCQAAIYMELPLALYVNLDEIAELRRRKMNNACSVGETDVEAFMEKAKPQYVTACAPLNSSKCVLRIPVHQRYQYAKDGGGYVNVTISEPKLLLGCEGRVKGYRISKIDMCEPCVGLVRKWKEIPYIMLTNRNYVWLVPIGNSSLSTFVGCITLFTTIIGAIFIANAISTSSPDESSKID